MSKLTRLVDILENYKSEYDKPDMVAGKRDGKWRYYSTSEFTNLTDILSRALLDLGLVKGDRVALMSGNRPEWNIVDFACNQIGIALVPLYPTLSAQDLSYIINNAEAKLIFVSNQELASKIDQAINEHALTITTYSFETIAGKQHIDQLFDKGKALTTDLAPLKAAVHTDDLLTLIYTSGTTGKPKGVFLTHNNILSNVAACQHLVPDYAQKALSFLPLCHIFERMVVYMYFVKGISINYAENLDDIVADINDVKPHILSTVPRVLEKVYDKVVEKGKTLTGIKKMLFFWALELGHNFQEPQKNSIFYNAKLAIARKLIFSKWKDALGGN